MRISNLKFQTSVTAVILAAGRSTRMGSPKALLPLAGTTFLGRLMRVYDRLALPLRVVLGPDWEAMVDQQPVPEQALLVNRRPEMGPLSSLRIALEALSPDTSGILLHPVDHPLVAEETIRRLVQAHIEQPGKILIPVFVGTPGHPTLFPSRLFRELREAPLEEGARSVVLADSARIVRLDTEDAGVLRNIDTPEDYDRWVRSG